jgi:tRNA pseudouridine55 synthase
MITKATKSLTNCDFQSGEFILIDKPQYWSSFKAVHKVRNAISEKKVGHAGTLDPLATGLLIIGTGKKTKTITQFQELPKTYAGIFTLGKTSPSMDTETTPVDHAIPETVNEEMILKIKQLFVGKITQTPPMYSAVKVKGKSLYAYARKGKIVERSEREVFIYDFKINKIDIPYIHFEITCSKGTYIRVLANDFGQKLGCGAILSSLRRTRIGEYSVNDALTIEEFVNLVKADKLVLN